MQGPWGVLRSLGDRWGPSWTNMTAKKKSDNLILFCFGRLLSFFLFLVALTRGHAHELWTGVRIVAASWRSFSSRWRCGSDALIVSTGWLTWAWHVLSCPLAHTWAGNNPCSFWSGVKMKSVHFYSHSKRAAALPKVVIFPFVSGWLSAVVCHTVDLKQRLGDSRVRIFGPRQGRKTSRLGPKGLVVTHS